VLPPQDFILAAFVTRLEGILKTKEVWVFARIDHSRGPAKVGLTTRPSQLLGGG